MLHELCKNYAPKYYCKNCDYNTSKKSSYANHLLSARHQRTTSGTTLATKGLHKIMQHELNNNTFVCSCGKKYKHHSSIWKHKKKCNSLEILPEKENIADASYNPINTDIIIELLKQNNEFKTLLTEQNKHILELVENKIGTGNITNNTISHNKFNLNFFLNEQCKDAMNIKDFVNSLQLQLSDIENVGESGYAEGISKIFINGLKELDIFKRPIHCSDVKRETLYVKDKDAWEKENQEKEMLHWAIKNIAHKNVKQIQEWQEKNPEYKDGDSTVHEQFLKIVNESMGGYTDGDDKANYNKIIRNVAKQVTIERQ